MDRTNAHLRECTWISGIPSCRFRGNIPCPQRATKHQGQEGFPQHSWELRTAVLPYWARCPRLEIQDLFLFDVPIGCTGRQARPGPSWRRRCCSSFTWVWSQTIIPQSKATSSMSSTLPHREPRLTGYALAYRECGQLQRCVSWAEQVMWRACGSRERRASD